VKCWDLPLNVCSDCRFLIINFSAVATKLFEWAGSLGWVAYSDELKGIAKKGDISGMEKKSI
jgi:hypothetical protein